MRRKILAAAAIASLLAVGTATPAHAETMVSRSVFNKAVISTNYHNYSNPLPGCRILTSGGTCTISSGRSATRSISLDLGFSRSFVAGNLNISSSYTVTTSQSCTSPAMAAGTEWRAWPLGQRIRYQLRERTVRLVQGIPVSDTQRTSGFLYAFNPDGRIACG